MPTSYERDTKQYVIDALACISIETVLMFVIEEFEQSNALEFATINTRVKLARMLLNPAAADCLDHDKAIPECGVAAYKLLGGE